MVAAEYSPTIAPIIASTLATLSAVNTKGSAAGTRTRRQISSSEAAYERMSSTWRGLALCRPRIVFTITGRKQGTAEIAIFECGESGLNQTPKIGANATIGTAFAAIATGMKAFPKVRNRPTTSRPSIPSPDPIAKPPSASLNVYQPAGPGCAGRSRTS